MVTTSDTGKAITGVASDCPGSLIAVWRASMPGRQSPSSYAMPRGSSGMPWVLVRPVFPDRFPELLHEAGLVAVAVLRDDRRDAVPPSEGESPADGSAVVLHVHREPGDAELVEQPLVASATGQPARRSVTCRSQLDQVLARGPAARVGGVRLLGDI
jgi:hypothetical protein